MLREDRTMTMLWSEGEVSDSHSILRNGVISHEPTLEIEIACKKAVSDICALNWKGLTSDELVDVAWIY